MDCVVIIIDHSAVDYPVIAKAADPLIDTRNAVKALDMQSNSTRVLENA